MLSSEINQNNSEFSKKKEGKPIEVARIKAGERLNEPVKID